MQNYLIVTIAAQHIYRILHGKCGRTVLMHKSVKYQKSNEWAQRTSEISDTNQRVWNTVRIHFPWCIMFIICILRIKFLFNDKLCCTDSSKKLIKDVSYKLINVLTEDIQTVYHRLTHHRVVIFLQMPLNTLKKTSQAWGIIIFSIFTSNRANKLRKILVWFCCLYSACSALLTAFTCIT